MDTGTVVRAIDNLPSAVRAQLLERIANLVVETLAEGAPARSGSARGIANGAKPKAAVSGVKPKAAASSEKATEEQILAYIAENPDQRTEQIGAALGSEVKTTLKKLREAKMLKTKGQRRAMTYTVR